MALTHTPQAELGSPCKDFKLLGTDDQMHSLAEYKNKEPLLIMFICNHCPYVKAIESRLIQLALDLKTHQINTVAICSNDPEKYPEDSFENMKSKNYPFPYLQDLSQQVAKDFGAVCTPDFFLYDRDLKLAYRGRLDNNWKDESQVTYRELFDAALKLKRGQRIVDPINPSMGCSIKWR